MARGTASVEYVVLVAVIAAALVVAAGNLGWAVERAFCGASAALEDGVVICVKEAP